MLSHYLVLAVKVLLRRKVFTFISLFGISFTLLVLMVVTALFDHTFGPGESEPRQDRTLYVERAVMYGASEGAPLSILFAATSPERVQALVLYGAMARTTPTAG